MSFGLWYEVAISAGCLDQVPIHQDIVFSQDAQFAVALLLSDSA